MSDSRVIRCKIKNNNIIRCSIRKEIIKLTIKGGGCGSGVTSHNLLSNLDYDHAEHVGFQRQLIYTPDFKAYIVE